MTLHLDRLSFVIGIGTGIALVFLVVLFLALMTEFRDGTPPGDMGRISLAGAIAFAIGIVLGICVWQLVTPSWPRMTQIKVEWFILGMVGGIMVTITSFAWLIADPRWAADFTYGIMAMHRDKLRERLTQKREIND